LNFFNPYIEAISLYDSWLAYSFSFYLLLSNSCSFILFKYLWLYYFCWIYYSKSFEFCNLLSFIFNYLSVCWIKYWL